MQQMEIRKIGGEGILSKFILYHGSSAVIEKPLYGAGKVYNDYGRGFYCTEHPELAKEWACTEGTDGYVNQYELETESLKILNLSDEEYTILHWLSLLMEFRKLRLSTPVMRRGAVWLKEHFLTDLSGYDAVIGYRADDSYFSFARAFVNNEISLKQLSYAMKLGKLGEQFVLKSEKAFEKIQFLSVVSVSHKIYYVRRKARDEEARAEYLAQLDTEDMDGLFMRDLIREEVMPDDPRIR